MPECVVYLVTSLAWSTLGLLIGAGAAQVGWDIRSLISGRRKR